MAITIKTNKTIISKAESVSNWGSTCKSTNVNSYMKVVYKKIKK